MIYVVLAVCAVILCLLIAVLKMVKRLHHYIVSSDLDLLKCLASDQRSMSDRLTDQINYGVDRILQADSAKVLVIQDSLARLSFDLRDMIDQTSRENRAEQTESLQRLIVSTEDNLKAARELLTGQGDKIAAFQLDMERLLGDVRTAYSNGSRDMNDLISTKLQAGQKDAGERMDKLSDTVRSSLQQIVDAVNARLAALQASNEKRLDTMQEIVDEKLQKTLDSRLAASFNQVSEQLASVGQGLGEMRSLAGDVGSLKNALTNVKARGTYGEVRCGKLLADILAPNQYACNVNIKGNNIVEFVVKLPGGDGSEVLLPIDSKFPVEDYNRLLDAEDKPAIEAARKALRAKIRAFAKDIHDKYIEPPKTTGFAVMFLPTEGLYAEVVQDAGLFEELRDKYQVTAVGMTTLSAFLSSLQVGFKTLAIERRSQDVIATLSAVKSEIGKFGGLLEKAQKQVQSADHTLSMLSGTRLNAINRKLRGVDAMPEGDAMSLLGLGSDDL